MTEINDFLDAVIDQDFSKAGPMFNELLGAKVNDALDQEKIAVADQVFNGAEVADEVEDDISDEELDAMLADALADAEIDDEDFEEIQDMNQDGKIEAGMAASEEPEEE